MNQPDFSIIIPCFNSSGTIQRTLDGLVRQDFDLKKVELLIIDDCSTDETPQVIQSYDALSEFGIVQIFKTQINSGPGIARNLGIDSCTGRYIIFVDSDDVLSVSSLKSIYGACVSNSDIVLFDGKTMSKESPIICKHSKMLNKNQIEKAKILLNLETDEHVIFSAYRRCFLVDLPRFKAGVYEDALFSGIAYLHAQTVEHIPYIAVNKFLSSGQITANMSISKAKQYFYSRLDLSDKIMQSLSEYSHLLTKYYTSGIRGSIAVALHNLEKSSKDQDHFKANLNEFFDFASSCIDNLESIVLNHEFTIKDIQTLNFYKDWKEKIS